MNTLQRMLLSGLALQLACASCTLRPARASDQVNPAWGQPVASGQTLRLTVDLADGSRLVGTPGIKSLAVQTPYAKLEIALDQVRSVAVAKDRESAAIELANGDRVNGALVLKALELQTTFGKVKIGAELIVKIAVERGGMLGRDKFDLSADFSLEQNPAGTWSYGWTRTAGGELSLFKTTGQVCPGMSYWTGGENLPFMGINTGEEVVVRPTADLRARQVFLHPGLKGECAVARWTAPRMGSVRITGRFFGLSGKDGGGPRTTTDVHIFHAGKEVFTSGINVQGQGNESPFNLRLAVQPGDALDFIVGYGNGNHYDDITGLDAQIRYGN